jgi:hypothetical protein
MIAVQFPKILASLCRAVESCRVPSWRLSTIDTYALGHTNSKFLEGYKPVPFSWSLFGRAHSREKGKGFARGHEPLVSDTLPEMP